MKTIAISFGIFCAIALHAGVILFGGLLFASHGKNHGTLQEVELISEDVAKEEKPEEPPPEDPEELETETEEPPDAAEIMRNLETPAIDNTPALEEASLSAIADALSGQAGGGDFAEALSFSSGGRIGGTGKGGAMDEQLDDAFSLAEIDQKPRSVFQGMPAFPTEMRGKKVEGHVSVIFVVDAAGKVVDPRVEKSSHAAFEKPALDAVKRWKFEAAVKAGQRVACKMRVSVRFPPG